MIRRKCFIISSCIFAIAVFLSAVVYCVNTQGKMKYSSTDGGKLRIENDIFQFVDKDLNTDIRIMFPQIEKPDEAKWDILNLHMKQTVVGKFLSMFFLGNTMHTEFEIKNITEQSISVLHYTSVSNYGSANNYAFTINISFSDEIVEIPLSDVIDFNDVLKNFRAENFEVLHGVVPDELYHDALKSENDIRGYYVTENNKLGILTDWYASGGDYAIFQSYQTIEEIKNG